MTKTNGATEINNRKETLVCHTKVIQNVDSNYDKVGISSGRA